MPMPVQWMDRADLWKSKARSIHTRLRDRFRIAVDKHRRRPMFSYDGYLSSTVQRWRRSFRDFRRESLPSTSALYRKRVNVDFSAKDDSILVRLLQSVAVPLIGNACHVFMHGFNRVQVYGIEKFHQALLHRPPNKPLLTVSNHVASVDDPFVIASLLPPSILLNAQNLRWTLCASDRCFTNPVSSAFFRCVKVLPVSRGDGVHQKGMDMAIAKLNAGGWVHIFPEGSRSRDGGRTMGSAKRGVGRLILDADNMPIVVPFVHKGMQEIMPIGAKLPRIGKTVTVLVGDPIYFDDLLNSEGTQQLTREEVHDAISTKIGHRLQQLKAQADNLELENSSQLYHHPKQNAERAAELLQQVDWESFGVANFMSSEEESSPKQVVEDAHGKAGPPRSQPSGRSIRVGFSYGTIPRVSGYMDPTEHMGFAARGLFMSPPGAKENTVASEGVGPLKASKQFLEVNVMRQLKCC